MLTETKIKKAKPEEKKYKLNDGDGLFLLVMPNGSKLWRMRFMVNGKTTEISLGKYPYVTLQQSRSKRAEIRQQIQDGINPKKEKVLSKKKTAGETTFAAVANKLVAQKAKIVTPKTIREINSKLNNHLASLHDADISEITTDDIREIVERIDNAGHSYQAVRVLRLCGEVFRYGIINGVCKYDVSAPLQGLIKRTKTKHMPAITNPSEIGRLLVKINSYHGSIRARLALRLMPYVFVRTKEIRFAEWSEIDWNRKVWIIPADKMKMARPHIVPLSHQALEILKEMESVTGGYRFIFVQMRGGKETIMSDATVNKALSILGYKGQMVGHGFRAMASTLLHEKGYSPLHIEMQLAHAEKNSVKAAYNHAEYLDARTKMMQEWADYLDALRRNS